MKLSRETTEFEGRLGHRFGEPTLLTEALTHPSLSSESRASNQRLEFLGDRVLNLAIAEALFESYPMAAEGDLAPRYNALVRKETCAEVAREIGLGDALRVGRGEMLKGGRKRDAGLGDAMEAVIAAVYLDAGFGSAKALVQRLWGKRIATVEAAARNVKSALQEWAQARGMKPPAYDLLSTEGPPHDAVFTVEARLENGASAQARGKSKRAAEQAAAEDLLARMEADDD
jgi:ribonuclease-3